jgi:MFS family permease
LAEPIVVSPPWTRIAMTFANVLSGTMLIPVLRPLLAALVPAAPDAAHAFIAAGTLGGIVGAPALAALADRFGHHDRWLRATSVLDAALLLAMLAAPPMLPLLLVLRTVQGAASVGALSLLMASGRARDGAVLGAAVVAAIAIGHPLGAALLGLDPRALLGIGAGLQLAVAIAARAAPPATPATATPTPPRWRELRPLAEVARWVAAERFAVGAFVVTFALWAHGALGMSDREVAIATSCFVCSFALAIYPMARLAEGCHATSLARGGLTMLAVGFVMLPHARGVAVEVTLVFAGVGAAISYGAALRAVGERLPARLRATGMAALNAAGNLGMLAGTIVAGILTVVLRRYPSLGGVETVIFTIAALVIAANALGRRSTDRPVGELPRAAVRTARST